MGSAQSGYKENPRQHINILSNFLLFAGLISMGTIFVLGWYSYRLLRQVQTPNLIAGTNQPVSNAVQNNNLSGFITDLSKTSISLQDLYKQGPTKDSIPAINNPAFIEASVANLSPDEMGILIDVRGEHRFYPYNILVWHNIVNDIVGEGPESKYIAISYCPISGTSAVFDRYVQGETLDFGVSGLLYESNLVMYDRKSESLWSQSMGKSVAGKFNAAKLNRFDTQVVSFGDVQANYPDSKVLSSDTGFVRDYTHNPYAEYQKSDVLHPEFKLSFKDDRYSSKRIFYVVESMGKSIAIDVSGMENGREYSFDRSGIRLTATKENGVVKVLDLNAPTIECAANNFCPDNLQGYYEMWFSWAVQHKNDGIVWEAAK